MQNLKRRNEYLSLKKYAVWLLCCWGLIFSSAAYSETASAQDQDTLVAGKIIAQQQKSASSVQAVASSEVSANPVANDLADGQSIRALPSMNAPVIDEANLLSAAQKQAISEQIQKLYQSGKAQVAVVIVPTTGQEAIFDYAMRVGEKWQLGSKKRDNGLLIAVAVNDRRVQILTGYGLEGVIPDIVASHIIRNQMTPLFKEGQYAAGIQAGLNEIQRILNLDPAIAQQAAADLKEQQAQALHEQHARSELLTYCIVILIVGVFASMILGRAITAGTAGVAGVVAGLVSGVGLLTSLLAGLGIFVLLITSVAQLILQILLSFAGNGGGRGGGSSGGGYGGGGGRFGGGGASGSW